MILAKQGVVVFSAKSVRGKCKKSYDQLIFSANLFLFVALCGAAELNTIKYKNVLYHDSSLQDRVDFLVSQTDTASHFVWKILVEKLLSVLPK